jgi:hypothetical protein
LEVRAQASRAAFLARRRRLRLRVVVFLEPQQVNLNQEDSLGRQPHLHNRRPEGYLALQWPQISRKQEVSSVRQRRPRSHRQVDYLEPRLEHHNQLPADYSALRLQNRKLVDFLDHRQQSLNLKAGDFLEQLLQRLNRKLVVGFSVASTTKIRTSHPLLCCKHSSSTLIFQF